MTSSIMVKKIPRILRYNINKHHLNWKRYKAKDHKHPCNYNYMQDESLWTHSYMHTTGIYHPYENNDKGAVS